MLPNDNVSTSVGHLDHVLIVYSSMEHVTLKAPGPMCGWVGRILHPDSCTSVSSWSKVPLLSIWSVAVLAACGRQRRTATDAVLEVSFWALTTVVKFPWKFLTSIFAVLLPFFGVSWPRVPATPVTVTIRYHELVGRCYPSFTIL